MIVAVCIDDKNGMMFHQRRQSRDRLQISDLVAVSGERKIRIHPYSQLLFEDYPDHIATDEHFLDDAGEDDICFVENVDLSPYTDRIHRLILYRWNRHYPSDLKLTLDLSRFVLQQTTDFQGSSHHKITREEYSR